MLEMIHLSNRMDVDIIYSKYTHSQQQMQFED